MAQSSEPPQAYKDFIQRFPMLGAAWSQAQEAGHEGPLDSRMQRLVKLSIAIGAMREGAIRASVRKAVRQGISADELYQVVALAAGTLGFPSTVAVHSWIKKVLEE